MAKKKVVHFIKLQIPAGAANPAPPVGPALGAAQVNIMQFCQAFNAATQDKAGDIIPVEISQLTQEQLTKIAEIKMPDLNANDIEAAKKIVAGTARSMGVTIAE